ncbi:MAG: CRISPR-associated endonuclease Cas2 [Rhabdochlamydiaceae bacterium]
MKENMYYATYDVSDNGTRESIINILKNSGFTRIQKIVFCGKISNQQKKDIVEKIKIVIDETDSFYLMMACATCFGKISIVGKGFDKEYVSDEKGSMIL